MLRVMTLNLWNLSGRWRDRRREVVAWITRLEPDLVCLQEVVDDGDRNTARWLATECGFDDGVAFAGVGLGELGPPSMQFGNAVLTRWAVDHEAAHPLPNAPGPTDIERLLLHVRTNGIDVFCTHLTSLYPSGRLRELQCLAIDAIVAAEADPGSALPAVLAGDFNADPNSNEIRFLSGLGSIDGRSTYWQDAWVAAGAAGGRGPGWTWDNRNAFAAQDQEADRRIDYVFSGWRREGGAGRVEACRVVCDRSLTGTFASDHFGVLAEIGT